PRVRAVDDELVLHRDGQRRGRVVQDDVDRAGAWWCARVDRIDIMWMRARRRRDHDQQIANGHAGKTKPACAALPELADLRGACDLAHASRLKVADRLHELLLAVHHERTV